MKEIPDISIIGPGKVGTALGILAAHAGLRVVAVGARDIAKAKEAAKKICKDAHACSPTKAASLGKLVLLTVSDDAIAQVCDELAKAGAFKQGSAVVHCSGALESEILSSARDKCGCYIGSLHPMQTFPSVEAGVENFPGTYCFCEGDNEAVCMMEKFVAAIGGQFATIQPGIKAIYHAAGVMSCNYITALMAAAIDLAKKAGAEEQAARQSLSMLAKATIENIASVGPAEALTGPVARGEVATLKRHLEALGGCDENLIQAYKSMGKLTIDLAIKKGTIDASKAEELRNLFGN